MKNVLVIDYNMGNLSSVANAVYYIGGNPIISNKPKDIKEAEYIILPGVGTFNNGMKNLINLGLCDILIEQIIDNKKPFLGICLGMQLLAQEGHEWGVTKGLGVIKGKVDKLKVNENLRLPHIGWNDVYFKKECKLISKLNKSEVFYFLNSYHLIPDEDSIVVGTCNYGNDFVAVINNKNIFGTQFHPEKSQKPGLLILKNFLEV